jgi:hypothetical protein
MLMRLLGAATIILAVGQDALASEKPTLLRRVSCTLVRFYVTEYSEAAAETWARSHGASDAEIETARKCLISSNVHSASFSAK